ncbi:hypothetical protein [Staphylococcus gallinarum]|uniref:hypothetical protein n=1 Tax=Staphylococcus gallinarum TaxID=1293 RepID=UPI000D1E32AA|nr:hypothetical protein [Staphylococcus gallinarum]PTK88077.1 hypothetical protein BUZ13_14110 [Staphylococcus gallinarum]PTK89285.1 hypothetical protein BUZ05_12015 [Staphylococcus gallinarum]RIO86091.1 hypothetical protein BUZ06_13660 [Staphylococcus gallinarum]
MDVKDFLTELDSYSNYLTTVDCENNLNNEEISRMQGDISYKLDQIIQNYDNLSKEEIISLLSKIALVNRVLAEI